MANTENPFRTAARVGLLFAGVAGAVVVGETIYSSFNKQAQPQFRVGPIQYVDRSIYTEQRISVTLPREEARFGGVIPALNSRVLALAEGTCIAGIDHNAHPAEVKADLSERSVRVHLGEPEVFSCGNLNIQIWDGSRLIGASDQARNAAQQAAIDKLLEEARAQNLAEQAKKQAKVTEENKLYQMGFRDVLVTVGEENKDKAPEKALTAAKPTSIAPAKAPAKR